MRVAPHGDPAPHLRELSKKLVDMATVVSKFKSLSKRVQEDSDPSTSGLTRQLGHRCEQMEHKFEQAKDALMAAISKNTQEFK
jgi:hypothetical protein